MRSAREGNVFMPVCHYVQAGRMTPSSRAALVSPGQRAVVGIPRNVNAKFFLVSK